MNEDNIDNSSNNGGIFSKFKERLRKIRISRIKKKRNQDKFIQDKVYEIRNELGKDNVVYVKNNVGIGNKVNKKISKSSVVKIKGNDKIDSVNNKVVYSKKSVGINKDVKEKSNKKNKKVSKSNVITNKVKVINENKPKNIKKRVGIDYSYNKREDDINNLDLNEKESLIKSKGEDIINKLKISFEDRLDELAVIESELYLVSQKQDNAVELKRVNELRKEISELIDKINSIIDEYNIYNSNYYIDNVIGINDNIIVDDIINYRRLLDSLNLEKKFVKEYNALEEFKSLRSSLESIKKKTNKIKEDNEEKFEKFNIRDKKYDNIKLKMVKVKDINKKCNEELAKQSKYFANIITKVNKIDKEEYFTTHMKGIGSLINQSLRYMGLMMVSPLAGFIPSIAIQTIATKKMIGNIYKNLHPEEFKHIKYSAIDYDSELNKHLTDIDYTDSLLNSTLDDVKRLKEDFLIIYNSNLPGYEDTLRNIKNIENIIIHNQNRVDIVRKNLNKSKKINNDKLRLVKKLNND